MSDLLAVRPPQSEYGDWFANYVSQAGDGPILGKLAANPILETLAGLSGDDAGAPVAPGKWSPKQILGHIAETERVMAYRALRIARADQTPLPGFDQDLFVANAGFNQRTLESLLEEMQAVRAATLALFRGLPLEAWTRIGTVSGYPTSVRALAWIIAGHELHHVKLLA
jgi:hypothetical protein